MKTGICIFTEYLHYVLVLLTAFNLFACQDRDSKGYDNMKINYPVGSIPEIVTPFDDANSEFDDFNSGATPVLQLAFPFYFSSNRSTQGGTFDIESMNVNVMFNQNTGNFSMTGWFFDSAWPGVNSPSNEYGPVIEDLPDGRKVYLYASDLNDNLDIYHAVVNPGDGIAYLSAVLNSTSADAYPTFGPDNSIYFNSNRGGEDFDIYQAAIPDGVDIPTWLAGEGNAIITRADVLSTLNNDKCPYINGKLLVFTSDRAGGYGGYDLYYSTYENGWSAPVNFGPSINTAYDEYRPIVIYAPDYSNDLMIFSSNRTGGKGGFDLYYVGIPKETR